MRKSCMKTIYTIEIDNLSGGIKTFAQKNDKYKLNWVEGNAVWGIPKNFAYSPFKFINTTISDKESISNYKSTELECKSTRIFYKEYVEETYEFKNVTGKKIFIEKGGNGIYTTLNDNYQDAKTCMNKRCHAHIWCGENSSYIYGLRMSGEGCHFGLVVTEGEIIEYAIERGNYSEDRGDIILLMPALELNSDETYRIKWKLFFHCGYEEFIRKALSVDSFAYVTTDKYTIEKDEIAKINVKTKSESFTFDYTPVCFGDNNVLINYGNNKTHININVVSEIENILKNRCKFIITNQQCQKDGSMMEGAYLCYDKDTKMQFSGELLDQNSARERIGMGVFLAKYLQINKDKDLAKKIEKSLNYYEKFLRREIIGEDGIVYNQIGKDNSFSNRLYNYPWVMCFMYEMYKCTNNKSYLIDCVNVLDKFYFYGGEKFYAICLFIYDIVNALIAEELIAESKIMIKQLKVHADMLIEIGCDYPGHEVTFEQSIVAPAATILLESYLLTKEKKYLSEAKKQIKILECFSGEQPDYHLNKIAIRHWDGYWFGKGKLYGDTFPHYWSACTAVSYYRYAQSTYNNKYYLDANEILRNNLCLFEEDGNASCAYLYPYRINGVNGKYFDRWANDQDWALYFLIKFSSI